MKPDLSEAAARMRALARQFDANAEALYEVAFARWCNDTVFPEAVNRLIREIGESVR